MALAANAVNQIAVPYLNAFYMPAAMMTLSALIIGDDIDKKASVKSKRAKPPNMPMALDKYSQMELDLFDRFEFKWPPDDPKSCLIGGLLTGFIAYIWTRNYYTPIINAYKVYAECSKPNSECDSHFNFDFCNNVSLFASKDWQSKVLEICKDSISIANILRFMGAYCGLGQDSVFCMIGGSFAGGSAYYYTRNKMMALEVTNDVYNECCKDKGCLKEKWF